MGQPPNPQLPPLSRFWCWSKSCKPFQSITAIVKIPNLPQLPFSIQLNVDTVKGYGIQNLIQFDPPASGFPVWQTHLFSTKDGNVIEALESLPRSTFLNVPSYELGFVDDSTSLITAIASRNINDNIIEQASKPFATSFYDPMLSVNLAIVGLGDSQITSFPAGTSFDIGLYFQGITDLTADGQNFTRSPPSICGEASYPITAESSNLAYQLLELNPSSVKIRGTV